VLTASNKVFGFGWNKAGRIGLGSSQPAIVSTPAEVKVISDATIKVVALSAGAQCSIALDSAGNAYSWGCGSFGNLGHGDEKDRHVPTKIDTLTGKFITNAVIGAAHALAVAKSGEVFSWGQNASGQLGHGAAGGMSLLPKAVYLDAKEVSAGTPLAIAAGKAHSCLIDSSGLLYTWGKGTCGVLGLATENSTATPTRVQLSSKLTQVECGWLHTCALTVKGEVYAFGGKEFGKLGFL